MPRIKRLRKSQKIYLTHLFVLFSSFILVTLCLVFEPGWVVLEPGFQVGEPASRNFFSPIHYTYVDEETTLTKKKEAANQVLPIFRINVSADEQAKKKATEVIEKVQAGRVQQAENSEVEKTPQVFSFELSSENAAFLSQQADLAEIGKTLEMFFEKYFGKIRITEQQKQSLLEKKIAEISLIDAGGESRIPVQHIPTVSEIKSAASNTLKVLILRNRQEREIAVEIFKSLLAKNLYQDDAATKNRRLETMAAVSKVTEPIKKNELLIQRGMLVTEENKIKVDQIQKTLRQKKVFNKLIAVGLLVLLLYLLGFIYMIRFERKLFISVKLTLLLHTSLFLTVLISKMISLWSPASPYLMPVSLAPLLLALLMGPQIAILSGAVIGVMIASLANFDPGLIMMALVGSTAGVFSAGQARKRIHFIRVGVAIGIANFTAIFALQIFEGFGAEEALLMGIHGLANGFLITTPIAFLLLPVMENIFDRVTDVTLLELSDLNHPLLKRMIVEAPGTYHHSLVVSTLAERACEAIGANALLARVGCYFHDIGKISKAEYFTENAAQQAALRHSKITPTMSCLIILNHVKEGVDLAKKHKLKGPIINFIPEHQGTGIVYFFYRKALDQAKPGEKIDPNDFRYPGPNPQSRETAIALLADSTEAASRSLQHPTEESIRQLVRKIINDKFIDGQLNECNLTLRDLQKIQESFIRSLMAIFHTRVSYPEKPTDPEAIDLFKEKQFSKFRISP